MQRASSLPLALAISLIACKGPPKPGTAVTFATVCDAKNAGQRVTLEGYVGMSGTLTMCSDSCGLALYPTPNLDGKWIQVSINLGDDKNQMTKLPDHYTAKDLKIETNDGTSVGAGAKIRVTGAMLSGGSDGCQLIHVDLVERG